MIEITHKRDIYFKNILKNLCLLKNISLSIKFLILIILTGDCFSDEIIYIKTTQFSTKPKSSIEATSIDKTTKWFDDKPNAENNDELEVGFYLPNNYGLSFRKSHLHGVHEGEATKQVCILGYCSFVGAGIVTGNSITDKISYDIDSLQIIFDKSYKLFDKILFKPRLGVNLLDTMLNYSGTGEEVDENQIVPLPFTGLMTEYEINNDYSLYVDTNYFKFNQSNVSVHYYDTSIGINKNINKHLKFYIGYKKYDFGISNKDGKSNISFEIIQNTPFIGMTLSY